MVDRDSSSLSLRSKRFVDKDLVDLWLRSTLLVDKGPLIARFAQDAWFTKISEDSNKNILDKNM